MIRFSTIRSLALLALGAALPGCGDGPVDPRTVDRVAPVVELTRPAADTLYPNGVGAPPPRTVEGTVTDSAGVVRVTYQLNGGAEEEVSITPGRSVPFAFSLRLAEGANTLVVHAYDAAGNRGSSPARRLVQDTRGPVVQVVPGAGASVTTDTVRLVVSARDPAGVVRARYRSDQIAYPDLALSGDTLVRFELLLHLRPGENTINLYVFDRAGNESWQSFALHRRGLTFQSVTSGRTHTCALTPAGEAYCWTGLAGEYRYRPLRVDGGPAFRALSAGSDFTCGTTAEDAAYCWGRNWYGQLGTGSHGDASAPVPVSGGIAFRAVSAGEEHACGVSVQDVAYCWGRNERGELGSTGSERRAPAPVAGALPLRAISAGTRYTCALTPEGSAYCWGDNASGQLGNGTTTSTSSPTPVFGDLRFRSIAAGVSHTCAVTTGGTAYCWGSNLLGELGTGGYQEGSTPTRAPVAVGGALRFASVAVGSRHSCALTADGTLWCWGDNVEGQLGTGSTTGSPAPVRVAGGHTFRSVAAGGTKTCAATTADRLYCWGDRTPLPTLVPGQ